jgi:GT2 family glycosyltransferase
VLAPATSAGVRYEGLEAFEGRTTMSRVAVVVIGRNEGRRLPVALHALGDIDAIDARLLYVDSGSIDDSVAIARERGSEVHELDPERPFSAARARNEGFDLLLKADPDIEFVQFVDGDCEMEADWFAPATEFLDRHPEVGIVCGTLRESDPDASVYNRIAEIEWTQQAIGEIEACGGILMVRAAAFRAISGFDPTVLAGEEPEMCQRMRAADWKVHRLDVAMAQHDAAMTNFGHWWTRQLRTGRFTMEVADRFAERSGDLYRHTIWSARFWVWSGLAGLAAALIIGLLFGTLLGVAALACVVAIFILQVARIGVRTMREGRDPGISLYYGWLSMVAKIPHIIGQVWYLKDRLTGESAPLIEYKRAEAD